MNFRAVGRFFSLLASSILLFGCAAMSSSSKNKEPIYENYVEHNNLAPLDKITSFRFHSWRSLDNQHLILSSRLNRPYLIKLSSYCSDLRFANTILINNDGNNLLTKFDSIQVARLDSVPLHREKCFIKTIYKLTKQQADEISQLTHKQKSEMDKSQSKKQS